MNDLHPSFPTPPPVPWTPADVFFGLVFFVLWMVGFAGLGAVAERLSLPFDLGLLVVFGELVLLVPVWYIGLVKYRRSWADLGLRPFRWNAVAMGCGLMVLSALFNMVYAALLALFDLQVQPDFSQLFTETSYPLALFFGGAVVAPVVEEIFFRGFVFAGLRTRWGWQNAAVVSAGLFALAHFVPTSILPIFLLGLIFALLYQVSGSIWPAILMHMLTNTLALSAAYAISQGWVPAG
ncbi:MAG: CPBP family intramembrane metalloprotease [Chloroflexi bacterium]|nr:MAG: CPBP family intramembrane metalloprotease [Chloroflexota bacterium]